MDLMLRTHFMGSRIEIDKVEISNYNKCKLLIFTQKIEEPLSTRVLRG